MYEDSSKFRCRTLIGGEGFFRGIVAAKINGETRRLFYLEVVHLMFTRFMILWRVCKTSSEFEISIKSIRMELFELFVWGECGGNTTGEVYFKALE